MEQRPKKAGGWFSRKHRTAAAHLKAKAEKAKHVENHLEAIAQRQADRKNRSDVEQLKLLDERLGEGIGAKKERARLRKRIEKAG